WWSTHATCSSSRPASRIAASASRRVRESGPPEQPTTTRPPKRASARATCARTRATGSMRQSYPEFGSAPGELQGRERGGIAVRLAAVERARAEAAERRLVLPGQAALARGAAVVVVELHVEAD